MAMVVAASPTPALLDKLQSLEARLQARQADAGEYAAMVRAYLKFVKFS